MNRQSVGRDWFELNGEVLVVKAARRLCVCFPGYE